MMIERLCQSGLRQVTAKNVRRPDTLVQRGPDCLSLKQVTKIDRVLVPCCPKQRPDAEDLLHRFQCGAVVVVNVIAVSLLASTFRIRRKQKTGIGPSLNWSVSSASSQMMNKAPPSL